MSSKWAEFNNVLSENAIKNGIPISAAFELTGRCNFSCKMCYVCHRPDDKTAVCNELSAREWIETGRQARDAGLFFLTLTGGEVFLRNDFFEIYKAFCEMGFRLTIYTNASLITREKARLLGDTPPAKVSITLYGASPETYARVTGHKDGYGKTIRGIEALKAENINVALRTTVVKDNYKEFYQLNNLAKQYGCRLGIVNYISPARTGCGSNPLDNRLSPELCAVYEKEAEIYNLELDNETTQDADKLNKKMLPEKSNSDNKSAFHCQAGKCGYWVNWKGYITPCGLLDVPCEKISDLGFAPAWEKLREECLKVPVCKECMNCDIRDYCMSCPARLMTETGFFDKPAPYLCSTAKNRVLLKTPV